VPEETPQQRPEGEERATPKSGNLVARWLTMRYLLALAVVTGCGRYVLDEVQQNPQRLDLPEVPLPGSPYRRARRSA
jgi:hypothetical protein